MPASAMLSQCDTDAEPVPVQECTETKSSGDHKRRITWGEVVDSSELTLDYHGDSLLFRLHRQCLLNRVCGSAWERSRFVRSDGSREFAVKFLVKKFEQHSFRDSCFVAVLSILDRWAAARSLRIATPLGCRHIASSRDQPVLIKSSDAFNEIIAAVVVVAKISAVKAEFDMDLNGIVCKLTGVSPDAAWWHDVARLECKILRALDYRVAAPSLLDVTMRIALEIHRASGANGNWSGFVEGTLRAPKRELETPLPRFTLLTLFLVEMGIAHASRELYDNIAPPIALPLAALHLAVFSFGSPPEQLVCELERAHVVTIGKEAAMLALPQLGQMLCKLWGGEASGSPVIRKWNARAQHLGGPLPKALLKLPPSLSCLVKTSVPEPGAPTIPKVAAVIEAATPIQEKGSSPPVLHSQLARCQLGEQPWVTPLLPPVIPGKVVWCQSAKVPQTPARPERVSVDRLETPTPTELQPRTKRGVQSWGGKWKCYKEELLFTVTQDAHDDTVLRIGEDAFRLELRASKLRFRHPDDDPDFSGAWQELDDFTDQMMVWRIGPPGACRRLVWSRTSPQKAALDLAGNVAAVASSLTGTWLLFLCAPRTFEVMNGDAVFSYRRLTACTVAHGNDEQKRLRCHHVQDVTKVESRRDGRGYVVACKKNSSGSFLWVQQQLNGGNYLPRRKRRCCKGPP